VADDTLTF